MGFLSGIGDFLTGNAGGSLIGGALGLFGGDQANSARASAAERMMRFEAEQAKINRKFQKDMSGSAHQREVKDLLKAGLNPILSGTGGMGAVTPQGATGRGSVAEVENTGDAAARGASSAMALRTADQTIKNMVATEWNTGKDSELKARQADLALEQTNQSISQDQVNKADRDLRRQQLETEKQRTAAESSNASILNSSAKMMDAESAIDETAFGRGMRYLRRFAESLGGTDLLKTRGFRK